MTSRTSGMDGTCEREKVISSAMYTTLQGFFSVQLYKKLQF